MAKRTLQDAYIYNGEVFGPGEVELPKGVDEALKAKGAFGDEPGVFEAAIMANRADAVDVTPEAQQQAEQQAQPARDEAEAAAAQQAADNAAALKRAAKGGK